jgi:hypothetical protein
MDQGQYQPHRWVGGPEKQPECYGERKIILWSFRNGTQFFGPPSTNQVRFQTSYVRFVVKKGRAKNLFLLSPISFTTPTLHTDISFIYLRRYIIVANDCVVHQNAFLFIPSGHTTCSLVTIPTVPQII